jgi:alkylhydroperoxidase/carboxymuconolactone decarboxylase family protein YurZ
MFTHRTLTTRLPSVFLALALMAAPALAQQLPGGAPTLPQELPEEVQELLSEAQESPDLQARQADLQELVDSTMRALEPEFDRFIERLGQLEQEAMAAQQSQDGERLQALMTEAQSVSGRLQAAQAQAMETPEIRDEMEAYEETLIDEMTRVDPETPQLLARMEELAEELEAAGFG